MRQCDLHDSYTGAIVLSVSHCRPWLVILVGLACNAGSAPDTPRLAPTQAQPSPTQSEPPASDIQGPPVRKDGTIYGETELMGTRVSINLYLPADKTPAEAGRAMQSALDEMARIEQIASEWKQDSELSVVNRNAGRDLIPVSSDLYTLLKRSKEISADTNGAFDVTFHGVGQLWSFRPGSRPPSSAAIAQHLPLVDWTQITVLDESPPRAGLRKPGMKIGLGAIAKGYAVDRAVAVLVAHGFQDHVVEAGGDTYASGSKAGKPWMIGVQRPDGPGSLGALPSQNIAVVTSGNYQRYFDHEGKRYAHILDPRTGWPLEHLVSPQSVTLLAENTTDADAYCTAVTVMGTEQGLAFVEAHDDLEAIFLDHDNTLRISSGLTDIFTPITDLDSSLSIAPQQRH